MAKAANKCLELYGTEDEVNFRKRRSLPRGVLNGDPITGNAMDDFYKIFWGHAAWIREVFLQNQICDTSIGMKMLRRVDRLRFYHVWNYCDKIDRSARPCDWVFWKKGTNKRQSRLHPRTWPEMLDGGKFSPSGQN